MESIVLIGGGGHCKSCIDIIEQQGCYNIVGILDTPDKVGQKVLSYPIIGSDHDLAKIGDKYKSFLITIGQIKSASLRRRLYEEIKSFGFQLPVIISPKAQVSKHAAIGEGTIIMHHAVINASATIGANCIINTLSNIEHDVTIGSHCHISTGAMVNGGCTIENEVFIGSRAVISQNIRVCGNSIIGMGAVVTKSITISGTYIGNPARSL